MKRILLSTVAITFAGMTAVAAPVSPNAARQIAEQVLKEKNFSLPLNPKGVSAGIQEEQPYYIFNADGNAGGYVIVAGDDRLPAVLGYSESGTIDLATAPDALKALLDMSVRSIGQSAPIEIRAAGTPVVEPLLGEINWGQDTPFNTMCPTLSSGVRGYVGCVATAMAQIMRFYSYPEKGMGSASYVDNNQTISANFGATTYDWANMPAAVPENVTPAQEAAYSTLSAHLGVAVEMQYAASGSGAYTHMVAPALRNYFGYSNTLRMHTREYYNTDEWMNMIRTELDAGHPVYYSASSEDGAGGHAFVCDGYDSEGFVHMNWGWYGRSNGYFYINHLNPGELGTGGGGGAYNIQQEILTGFYPAKENEIFTAPLFGATRLAGDLGDGWMTLMTFVENIDTKPFNGELLVVLTDQDENQILDQLYKGAYSLAGFKAGRPGAESVTIRDTRLTTELPDGNYHLKLAYRTEGEDEVHLLRHPVGLPSFMLCTIRNKRIVAMEKHSPVPNVQMTTPLSPDGDIYANGSARFSVELKNNSKDFRLSSLVLTLKSVENPTMSVSQTYPVNIYDLSAGSVVMDIDIPAELAEGDYDVVLAHDKYEDYPFATVDGAATKVTILPEARTSVLRFTSQPDPYNATTATTDYKRGDIIYGNLALKNYGAAGSCQVLMRAVSRQNPEYTAVVKSVSKEWGKGEKGSLVLSNALALDPGTYDCSFYYVGSDGAEMLMNSEPVELTMLESDSPTIEITEITIPEVMKQGERYPVSVSVKAPRKINGTLYIRLRQFTYTNGEIVYMKSGVNMNAGDSQTFSVNYRVGSSLEDGKYLTMVEFKEGSSTVPACGHSVYYKEIQIGDAGSGVDEIGAEISEEEWEWYTLDGLRIEAPQASGLYIRRAASRSEKVIIK